MNKYKITTLTPIFIQGDNSKNLSIFTDFILSDNYINIIDKRDLENIFAENENLINIYMKGVENGKNLLDFLKENKLNIEKLRIIKSLPYEKSHFAGNEILTFASENGKPYVPGSSLKGAIRTALFTFFEKAKLDAEVKNIINNERKINFKKIEEKFFPKNGNMELLSFLSVSDSNPFKNSDLHIKSVKSVNIFNQKREEEIPINIECIKENSTTEFYIDIKRVSNMKNNKILLNAEMLYEAINHFSKIQIAKELEKLPKENLFLETRNFYESILEEIKNNENKKIFIRIGKYTGILSKTILNLLNQDVRNQFIKKHFTEKNENLFPKSRLKYYKGDKERFDFGWVVIEEIK